MAAEASTPVLSRIATRRPSVVGAIGLVFVVLLIVWLVINFIKGESYFVEVFLIGIATGCVYALFALGYTLVYGILELINFAHGDVFMLGSMFAVTLVAPLGLEAGTASLWPLVIVLLLISMVCCGVINATIEMIAYRPLRHAPRLA